MQKQKVEPKKNSIRDLELKVIGKKNLIDIEGSEGDLSDMLKKLPEKLVEYEKLRDEMKKITRTTLKLIPQLEDEKKSLEKNIDKNQEKVGEIDNTIPKLVEKRDKLNVDIHKKLDKKRFLESKIGKNQEKIAEINFFISCKLLEL